MKQCIIMKPSKPFAPDFSPHQPASGSQPTPQREDGTFEPLPGIPAAIAPVRVVGIGASAGGLEALELFFDNMPVGSGMAFVVVQHLSPDYLSMMDEILARHTRLSIRQAEDGMAVEPDTIYLLPPKMLMLIVEGRLLLTERDPGQSLTLPIDIFFRSLAQDAGKRAVAIILSGSGSDGSRGIRDVHDAGGMVMAQTEGSAKFDSMPGSAIATGLVDHVLPPEAMPHALLEEVEEDTSLVEDSTGAAIEEGELAKIFGLLNESHGIDFAYYKPATVGRRIQRRMTLRGYGSLSDYVLRLDEDREELNTLYKDLLIGVTEFFRTPDAFDHMAKIFIPALLAAASPVDGVRVWVAGCATGEEVYSVAMLFRELLQEMPAPPKVKIFATDAHRESLEFAATGIYDESRMLNVSSSRRERFFSALNGYYQVLPELRQMIVFSQHDVVKSPPFTKLDLITCRNMLIYFQPHVQKKVLSLFHFALKAKGVLFLGPSETVGELENEFESLDRHDKIFAKRRDIRLSPVSRMLDGSPMSLQRLVMAQPSRQTRDDQRLFKLYDVLLERRLPPGLLINERRELIHTFGDAGKLLRHHGRTSTDILDLVQGDFRVALSTAIQRSIKEMKTVTFKKVRASLPEGDQLFSLAVDPIEDKSSKTTYLHITFEPVLAEEHAPESNTEFRITDESRNHIRDLEEELQHTKENLQASIEEMETNNEELQAANEELVASNEELQSTNEELHSVNEELYTVNSEYENKIADLIQLTRDIDNLLNSSEIETIFLDKSLNIRKYTASVTKAFNLLPQDIGRPIQHISSNLVQDSELFDNARLVMETGVSAQKEVMTVDGRWLLKRILPYRTEAKAIHGVLITFVDISRIKDAEAAVRASEGKFRVIFEQADMGIALLDKGGHFLETNPALGKMLGHSEGELEKMGLGQVLHQDDAPWCIERFNKLATGDLDNFRLDARCMGRDVEYLWGRLAVTRLRGVWSEPYFAIVLIEDISARKRMETEIVAAKEWAEAASCAKTEFLANMSHEIRTPISGIMGLTELLMANAVNTEDRQYLEMMQASVASLLGIVNDVLDLSKIEARMLDLNPTVFALEEMLEATVKSFNVQAREKGISLTLRQAPDIPPRLLGDPQRLAQVLSNLLANAVKFTETGLIVVDIKKTAEGPDGVKLEFSVKDTGIGITEEAMKRLFQSFSQGDSSYTKKYGGTGLGLVISKKLVEMMGGEMWVVSAPQTGSIFFFTAVFQVLGAEALSERQADALEADAYASGKKFAVLLAEDNQVNQIYISTVLRKAGHDVVLAANGQEVLDILKTQAFDLILMDVQMPEMNGLTATQVIRAMDAPQLRSIPIIALTAYAMQGDRERLLAAGMDDYIAKPVTSKHLFKIMNQVVASKRLPR